jgi:hypothetical protein
MNSKLDLRHARFMRYNKIALRLLHQCEYTFKSTRSVRRAALNSGLYVALLFCISFKI